MVFIECLGTLHKIRSGIVAKDELDTVSIPSVQVLRLREVSVTSQCDFPEACFATLLDCKVQVKRGMFMAGPITGAIVQVQWLLSFSQRNDQRTVSPLTFVVDTDAIFLFGGGFYHAAISFNRGVIEK
ncbi:MAG: hypothetical protein Pars93KO_27020 [Parasphingorhabdus sp.]